MEINKFWGGKILYWCIENLGESSFQSEPPKIRYYKKGKLYYGYYDEIKNNIIVFIEPHKTFNSFIGTIIHEYTHYKQNITGKYRKLLKSVDNTYYSHPYEIMASSNEKLYIKECKKDLRKLGL